jgi:hypothetical protein
MSNFMKIRIVGAELFHADGRKDGTGMTKLIVAFRNFENAPKLEQNRVHHMHIKDAKSLQVSNG